MKLIIKRNKVACPCKNANIRNEDCLTCEYLGIHNGDNVVCRWSKEKEMLKTGEAKYMDFAEK